jgi:hypothetical protein
MKYMAEVHDSCNVVLVGGYEQEDVIDAMDFTAIISLDKNVNPEERVNEFFMGFCQLGCVFTPLLTFLPPHFSWMLVITLE